MVSVKNEINEVLLNTVSDLENRLDESRSVLSDIQEKMDAKVSEAKEYKVQVDSAKESIKRLESEIVSLENDLVELKDKFGKKNLVAVIEAGTKEINLEIKKKQDEIQVHKNKIAELTNRARSIKDLLLNLKKDKKIKETRLEELESCTKYYKARLEEVVKFSEEHDDLDDYFISDEENNTTDTANVFEDIVGFDDKAVANEENKVYEEVSIQEADEVFNDVINPQEDIKDEFVENKENEIDSNEAEEIYVDIEEANEEVEAELEVDNNLSQIEDEVSEVVVDETNEIEGTHDLEINDLLTSVKEPLEVQENNKIDNINKAIDEEFENIFGKNINEPLKTPTIDIFGNEFTEDEDSETDIVNKLTNLGLDYYSFTENDRKILKETFNEQTISEIVNILNVNKIQLDNIYVDARILTSIAPAELEDIINKLLKAGQSTDAIGYVLDKLPLVDVKLMESTINNYGDYIKNVDIADIIVKSLKGDN